jgi:hypothetical protein
MIQFVAGFHVGMTVFTLLAYMVFKCRPSDYEQFCTLLGASMLWFITWPLAAVHWIHNLNYERQQEAKRKA